ncbi:hypothetical protein EDB81DRAFT_884387 [Dactylonectria macrodidyma]|uniref:Uncharacterized protein n=1 Tax=Dactylonectria macrodidyma TaxID=307937 RepID=A0A9P9ERU1_9HYPO|nr:hypothetical protein EDB81DRAFT_884387 [Dactylonectria macrodidyma]
MVQIIPLPTVSDNLVEIEAKLKAFAEVICGGDSLAVHAGHPPEKRPLHDPLEIARLAMTPREVTQYETWATGGAMPPINWKTNRKRLPSATPENAVWLSIKKPQMKPLVMAIVKIAQARKELVASEEAFDAVELEVTRSAIANSTNVLDNSWDTLTRITNRVISSRSTLLSHKKALKRKLKLN